MSSGNPRVADFPPDAKAFEDIIDGYFPLRESLRQMLQRNGFASACVTLFHTPIMDIPGLAPTAPVPLRLDRGVAGLADRLDVIVAQCGPDLRLCGYGRWRWYSDSSAQDSVLPASTRLAEPAIVQGIGLVDGSFHATLFDRDRVRQMGDYVVCQTP